VLLILKVRGSDFAPSLHEFGLTDNGVEIHDTPDSVERLFSPGRGD
jgi:hypothetical protein